MIIRLVCDINSVRLTKFEHIVNNIFLAIGSPRSKVEKCYMGCAAVSFILLVLIGPLAIFSGLNPNEELMPVSSGTISINLMTGGENGTSSIFEIFKVNNLNIAQVKDSEVTTA